jgi:hypothetical protein
VTVFALVGWWRGRGFRISYREGNSIMGFEGPLPFLFPFYFFKIFFSLDFETKLIESLWQLGMSFERIRSSTKIIHVFPFNSEKKRGGVAVKLVFT